MKHLFALVLIILSISMTAQDIRAPFLGKWKQLNTNRASGYVLTANKDQDNVIDFFRNNKQVFSIELSKDYSFHLPKNGHYSSMMSSPTNGDVTTTIHKVKGNFQGNKMSFKITVSQFFSSQGKNSDEHTREEEYIKED